MNNLDGIGIGASYDTHNKLVVQSNASLLNHDGNGHQLVVNKAAATDTGSLLFQTGYSGRAEMGLAGNDDFAIKTSGDGSTFNAAIQADAATGAVSFPSGVDGLTPSEFGDGALLTVGYSAAKGLDLVTNGTGLLGNNYNFPSAFVFDPVVTPNLPGSFSFSGHYNGVNLSKEFLPIDPNQVYDLQTYLRQDSIAGDWSAFTNQDRHTQYIGLACYDIDQNLIDSSNHMRFKSGGVDSMTTLAQPLSPGDTVVHLTNAAGWNDSDAAGYRTGIVIFGYKNNFGGSYSHYSRHVFTDLFDVANVNKTANTVTLNAPLGILAANPDDPNGTWPAGTAIANSDSGSSYKYCLLSGQIMDASDVWYRVTNAVGGVDLSGGNVLHNFPPGTAYSRVLWLPNYSNRSGGLSGFPDTCNELHL